MKKQKQAKPNMKKRSNYQKLNRNFKAKIYQCFAEEKCHGGNHGNCSMTSGDERKQQEKWRNGS